MITWPSESPQLAHFSATRLAVPVILLAADT